MLRIWGRRNSVNVKKALWCAEELGLPYKRIDAGLDFGVVNTPEFRRLNPNGLVPTIEDDGFVLWESHAIVRYLAARHGTGTLWPHDLKVRADADRWMDWAGVALGPAMRPAFWGLVRTPPEKRNAGEIAASVARAGALLAMADAALAGRAFIAGDAFTMGDIPLGCHAYNWMALPIERPPAPNLEAWYARLAARPAFRRVVMLPLS
jgi:glutathione S-transferase